MERDTDISGCTSSTSTSTFTDMMSTVGYEAEESEFQSSESSAGPLSKNPRDLEVCLCGAGIEDLMECSRRTGT